MFSKTLKSTWPNQARTLILKILFIKAGFEVSSLCGKENEKKVLKSLDSYTFWNTTEIRMAVLGSGCWGSLRERSVCQRNLMRASIIVWAKPEQNPEEGGMNSDLCIWGVSWDFREQRWRETFLMGENQNPREACAPGTTSSQAARRAMFSALGSWDTTKLKYHIFIIVSILCFKNLRTSTGRYAVRAKSLQLCSTLCDPLDCSPPSILCPWDSPGKNAGVGCHALLLGIFLTQESNPSFLCLLYWQASSLKLVLPGKPSTGINLLKSQGVWLGIWKDIFFFLNERTFLSVTACLNNFTDFSANSFHSSEELPGRTPGSRLKNSSSHFIERCGCDPGWLAGSVQSLSHVWLFAIPWTAARQASLSIINSKSILKLMSIESVMPSSHLILCHPLLLLPSIFPSTRIFSNESALWIRWPKYWSVSFNISPSNEQSGPISFRMDWLDLLAVQGTLESLL